MRTLTSTFLLAASSWLATLLFWSLFVACVEPSATATAPPQVRLVANWDPLACGPPHEVVLELEDDDGAKQSASALCTIGGLSFDAPHFGVYRGKLYAWPLDGPPEPGTQVELALDQPIIYWHVPTP